MMPTGGQVPLVVDLDASASADSDGAIRTYEWTFGDGSAAGSGVRVQHTFEQTGNFEIRLTVTDDGGASSSTTRTVTVNETPPPAEVVIRGRVTFDRVPFSSTSGDGLDYAATFAAPARQVTVEAVRPNKSVAATSATDENGRYSLAVPPNEQLFIRARAQSVSSGPSGWDLRVLDNTAADAIYVLDGSLFDSGVAAQTRNLHAASGWSGSNYSLPRAAAPFAILDTLYAAVQFVLDSSGATVPFSPLKVFWSGSNRASAAWDPDNGNIQTTLYWTDGSLDPAGIYVLGDEGADTDEFDQHVLAHEFHHYLEATLFRFDSPGGSHASGEKLDMRVSFSEGFANAFSGMVLADPIYRDSFGAAQSSDFALNLENNVVTDSGWYNEGSVQSISWDIFDAANETGDTASTGYAPMFDVLRNEIRNGQPLSSLFPFIVALKQRPGVPGSAVDQLVAAQGIVAASMEPFGSTETDSGGVGDVLPIYTDLFLNDNSPRTVCSNVDAGVFNKLGNRRFLKFNVPTATTIDIRVVSPDVNGPDPDLVLFKGTTRIVSDCSGPDPATGCTEPVTVERYNEPVEAGDYVLEVYDYSNLFDEGAPRTCMDVSVTG